MNMVIAWVIAGLVAGNPGNSSEAATESQVLYLAHQIPAERQAEITIDGDLSDWQWLAPSFATLVDFPFAPAGDTPQGFDVEARIAWNAKTNMVYHAIKVTDDQLSTLPVAGAQEMYRWDLLQVYIDGDHSGGDYRDVDNSAQAQQYFLYCLPDGTSGHLGLFGPADLEWSLKPPYAQSAVRYDGKAMYYEVAMTLWDWLGASRERSTSHQLKAGDVIGWKLTVKDRDGLTGRTDVCTLRPSDASINADTLSELKLVP